MIASNIYMNINMWSGPRNLSTALMRSFENRNDTCVWDEPLYAFYLKHTKLKHPMANEIIKLYKTDIKELIPIMTKKNTNYEINYLKHMTHHLFESTPIDWIAKNKNCLLIRNPAKVINSYIKKSELNSANDLGFPSQYRIFNYLKKNHMELIIINADDLVSNPKKLLIQLCKKLKIRFSSKMLKWPKGSRKTDGIWGKIWYSNVENSNSFKINKKDNFNKLPNKYLSIFDECNEIYKELNSFKLHFNN